MRMLGESNSNPLQYSYLENPMDGGAWVGCSPWARKESDTTERLHFHFSLSCTGEGNGNPLQSSCLENPRDGGAWWAAIYGVTQSGTRLKRLSSSSILKSREFTLPTMVHIVKAMAFPVVVYGCESWTIRRLSAKELVLLNCGAGEDSWESLGQWGDQTSQS